MSRHQRVYQKGRSRFGKLSIGLLLNAALALAWGWSAEAAERVTIYIGPLQFSVPVESLEQFAAGEDATGDLALILNHLDEQSQNTVRTFLQASADNSPTVIAQFTYSAMGEDLLKRIGTLIQTQSGLNGFYALRSALILAAADEEQGLTLLNILHHFPSSDLRLSFASVRQLTDEITLLSSERERAVEAIAQLSEQNSIGTSFLVDENAPDLRQPGTYTVHQHELSVPIRTLSESTLQSDESPKETLLTVDLYLPQSSSQPVPLVVFSPSLATTRSHFRFLGEHLASHGIAVAIPEHEGSNADYLEAFVRGEHRNLVDALEYPRRVYEISSLLDALEQHSEFSHQLNLEQVGIMGLSYGGTTALALAGAELNRDRLRTECIPDELTLNLSILLQCRVNDLPVDEYTWRDPRIQAVFAIFPPTSVMFGAEGLSAIEIPTVIVSASEDQLAPAVEEQIQPFQGLRQDARYLILLDPADHYVIDVAEAGAESPEFMQRDRPDPAIGRRYIQALSVAFFKTYLGDGAPSLNDSVNYVDYLSGNYVESIRQDELSIYLLVAPDISSEE